ncbi:ABC transporter ATP-binding protein [Tessaracoccus sp. MC1679]|uniref:ABC transporter ATP-binding protein n=1 Tax=Tessaracoccus sp. MC1679 TaxID=2760313 RepID=UPI0015FF3DCB|nr:ABC transporter ATP-binding protein [Tessaracoccus sp. MC1679]
MTTPLLLAFESVGFTYHGATDPALNRVTFALPRGESLGIVGESGSGKSTALKLLLALHPPTVGRVLFNGAELNVRDRRQVRELRQTVQPVFQDPYASLDPRMRVDRIVAEPLVSLGIGGSSADRRARVAAAIEEVGLDVDTLARYPHEFSGGQRQRIAIARALVTDPAVLVADEPVSALDVTTRIEVIDLLARLRRERQLSIVMVSHDMSVVAALCDTTLVLKDGTVIETGETMSILNDPHEAYTRQLISAIPRLPASPASGR